MMKTNTTSAPSSTGAPKDKVRAKDNEERTTDNNTQEERDYADSSIKRFWAAMAFALVAIAVAGSVC